MPETTTAIPQAVLFDLDGTLLDTAPDLVAAVNSLLLEDGREAVSMDSLRPWVSQGGLALIGQAYGIPMESDQALALRQRYLVSYKNNISRYSRLFDGLEEILWSIESSGRPWGVVTNKPGYLTRKLLLELGLLDRPSCVVCGDTAKRSKPWPDPVVLACRNMGISPEHTLMVGDDCRDIDSAHSAGADAVAAAWGYIRPDDDPSSWNAEAVLATPDDLWPWIDGH